MKRIILVFFIILVSGPYALATVDSHKKMRRILQHSFPDSMESIKAKWDGVEDLQKFIDRAVVWKDGMPHITADQIKNKETKYIDSKILRQIKRSRELIINKREEKINRDMAIIELKSEGKLPANFK